MNRFRKHIILMLIFSFMCISTYAKETKSNSYKATIDFETGKSTVVEEPLTGKTDNSSLVVNVTKTSAGIPSKIYTGTLGEYENGIWSNVDFCDIQGLLLFDWETEDTIWIEPVATSTSKLVSTEKSQLSTTADSTPSLMSISSNLAVTSNIRINGISVGENGMRIIDNANMSCTLGVSNSSAKDDSITAILATYTSEGRLHNLKTFKIDVGAGQTNSMEIVYQFDAENEYSGKLMIWNTLANLMPIRASIDFSQTSGINAYYYNDDNRLLQIDKANGVSVMFTYDNMGNLLSRTIRK